MWVGAWLLIAGAALYAAWALGRRAAWAEAYAEGASRALDEVNAQLFKAQMDMKSSQVGEVKWLPPDDTRPWGDGLMREHKTKGGGE